MSVTEVIANAVASLSRHARFRHSFDERNVSGAAADFVRQHFANSVFVCISFMHQQRPEEALKHGVFVNQTRWSILELAQDRQSLRLLRPQRLEASRRLSRVLAGAARAYFGRQDPDERACRGNKQV
jgi:hypothetical protein